MPTRWRRANGLRRAFRKRGVRTGELRTPPDMNVALDMIYGPIFYRLLARQDRVDAAFVRALVELLMRGVGRQAGSASEGAA